MKEKEMHNKLDEKQLFAILDNVYANIFVTNGNGKVIYVNENAARSLCSTEEYLIGKTSRELLQDGVITKSSTLEVLERNVETVGSFTNMAGEEITTVSTPVFDENGEIQMVVTFSHKQTDMEMFLRELEKERARTKKYKTAVDYLDSNKKKKNVIVYQSKAMEELCRMAELVAMTDSTIMLYGESGVGKEVFATYIHEHSARADKIFIPINCAAIPPELLESEFFGYERGAFTGASNKGKAGLFEAANNGTIFLDEIGELPLAMQSKLLRVLESGEYRRIGSDTVLTTNVRIIGATNRDLLTMSKEKTFREDLYYRLNVLPLSVPSLRDRKEDIEPLADYYLRKTNRKYSKKVELNPLLIKILQTYSWPGNVRELRNVMERFVITGNEKVIRNLIEEGKPEVKPEDTVVHASAIRNNEEKMMGGYPLKSMVTSFHSRKRWQSLNGAILKAS